MAKEIGRIGQNRYGTTGSGHIFYEEFLTSLQGIKGVQAYTEMADNDATVGAILYAIEMLMRQCEFHIEPTGNTKKDEECAEFIESCMHDMERTWTDTLSEFLSFLTYGWSYHEIVYKRRVGSTDSPITNSKHNDGLIGWRKLPIRSQDSFFSWEYKEGTDDLIGMTQMPPPTFERITIPIEKALHFRTRSRKDSPEGRSILRTAYRCFDEETEILTRKGWKKGIEIDLDDELATLNPKNKQIEYQRASEINQYLHDGDMIHMHSKFIDILVTENHRMWVKKDKADDYCIVEADKVKKSHSIMRYGNWKGVECDSYTIPAYNYSQKLRNGETQERTIPAVTLNMADWVAFLGLYLSEGCTWQRKNGNRQRIVSISQKEGDRANKIRELLARLPFNVYEHKKEQTGVMQFEISDSRLFNELIQFGKAKDKFIPDYVKSLDSRYLRILLDWLVFGDGALSGQTPVYNGTMTYGTISERLADDIQEIALLAGYEAQKRVSRVHTENQGHNFYCVSICTPKDHKIKRIEKIQYTGKVWCPTTSNGVVYVRRNGKPAWVGNCYYFKKRIEEIEGYGVERDLAGFPVLYAPPDMDIWSDDPDMRKALARAEMLVSSVRRDAREGLVLPGGENGWKFELVTSGSRRQFDTNAIIDRYDKRIATSVLADFVMLGQQQVGSFALADSKTKIFALAVGTYLDVICEVFNNQAIPRLVDINGDHFKGITDYPKMVHSDIEEVDLDQFTNALTGLVGNGILVPDEGIEDEVRRILHLPERIDTGDPSQQPGQDPQNPYDPNGIDETESKSIYKVTSIIEKYQKGTVTRNAAARLLQTIGLDEESINFYLTEADAGRKAAQEDAEPSQSDRKKKDKAEPIDDEEDARAAVEAKKSLGRGDTTAWWRKGKKDNV